MAEITQYSFTLHEVAKALVKQHGITSGKWIVGFNLGFSVGAFGTPEDPNAQNPGAMMIITGLNLSAAPKEMHEAASPPYIVDASKL
jgi:hypothetical protein